VELLKYITSEKPRLAPEAADAARFFDDDARNLYGGYLRNIKRKYAPHVPEACLMASRGISRRGAKKMAQMREVWGARPWRALAVRNKKERCATQNALCKRTPFAGEA